MGYEVGVVASQDSVTVVSGITTAEGLTVTPTIVSVDAMTTIFSVEFVTCEPSLTDTVTTYVPVVVGAVQLTVCPEVLERVPPVTLQV